MKLTASVMLYTLLGALLVNLALGYSLKDLVERPNDMAVKRAGSCPSWKPFQCPDGECIHIKLICDGVPDCKDEYDENPKMCTAAKRPPVQDTVDFLKAILTAYGDDFFMNIFGPKAKSSLKGLGGVEAVAVALSESATVDDFAKVTKLSEDDANNIREILQAIADNNGGIIARLGIKGSAVSDMKFFVKKLVDTGFLD